MDIEKAIYIEILMSENFKDKDSFISDYHKQISEWLLELNDKNNHKYKKHGMSKTRLYRIWAAMKSRCYNPQKDHYSEYGGRGIEVCDEWRLDFVSFMNWAIQNGYSEQLTLDRIDVNGNYCPENCRWITIREQNYNKRTTTIVLYKGNKYTIYELSHVLGMKPATLRARIKKCKIDEDLDKILLKGNNKFLTFNGVIKTYKEWEEEYGLKRGMISTRIRQGWSVEDAITTPKYQRYGKTIKLEYNNEVHTLPEWSEIVGLSKELLLQRYNKGWDAVKILTTPNRKSSPLS